MDCGRVFTLLELFDQLDEAAEAALGNTICDRL